MTELVNMWVAHGRSGRVVGETPLCICTKALTDAHLAEVLGPYVTEREAAVLDWAARHAWYDEIPALNRQRRDRKNWGDWLVDLAAQLRSKPDPMPEFTPEQADRVRREYRSTS